MSVFQTDGTVGVQAFVVRQYSFFPNVLMCLKVKWSSVEETDLQYANSFILVSVSAEVRLWILL